jgi:GTP-binding protein HflX
LKELDAADKPTILVFNKTDAFSYVSKADDDLTPATRENLSLDELKRTWVARHRDSIFISAIRKTNIDGLKDMLYQKVREIHIQRYPYNDFLY